MLSPHAVDAQHLNMNKYEMEEAARLIVRMAQRAGKWNQRFSALDFKHDNFLLRGFELLVGYGWLKFDADEELFYATKAFVKRLERDTVANMGDRIIDLFEKLASKGPEPCLG